MVFCRCAVSDRQRRRITIACLPFSFKLQRVWSACMNWRIDDKCRKWIRKWLNMSAEALKHWRVLMRDYWLSISGKDLQSNRDHVRATSQAGSKKGKAGGLTILRGIDAGMWWWQTKARSHRAGNGNSPCHFGVWNCIYISFCCLIVSFLTWFYLVSQISTIMFHSVYIFSRLVQGDVRENAMDKIPFWLILSALGSDIVRFNFPLAAYHLTP